MFSLQGKLRINSKKSPKVISFFDAEYKWDGFYSKMFLFSNQSNRYVTSVFGLSVNEGIRREERTKDWAGWGNLSPDCGFGTVSVTLGKSQVCQGLGSLTLIKEPGTRWPLRSSPALF